MRIFQLDSNDVQVRIISALARLRIVTEEQLPWLLLQNTIRLHETDITWAWAKGNSSLNPILLMQFGVLRRLHERLLNELKTCTDSLLQQAPRRTRQCYTNQASEHSIKIRHSGFFRLAQHTLIDSVRWNSVGERRESIGWTLNALVCSAFALRETIRLAKAAQPGLQTVRLRDAVETWERVSRSNAASARASSLISHALTHTQTSQLAIT